MKKWFAVYTKARCEKKVSALLTKKKIDNFLPLNKVARTGQYDYRNGVWEPLFSNVVFVYVNEMEMQAVRQVSDVVNFLYWLGRPAVIKDVELENVRQFMNDFEHVDLERIPVNANEMVRVVSTPGFESDGNVFTLKNNKVKLMLPSLGYTLTAETEKANVELISFRYRRQHKVS